MQKIIMLFTFSFLILKTFAQNVGIGTVEPVNKLQIHGNLLVTVPTIATITQPVPSQNKTMVTASTISFAASDSTGRIYDTGGPFGNYTADVLANASIPSSTNVGIEMTAETMDLNTGDSLIVKESITGTILLAIGNVYNSTGKWVFNSPSLYLIFKSNADNNIGAGFSLFFRRLYDNSASLPSVSGFVGNSLFFDAKAGSLRSGAINNSPWGAYSVGLGLNSTASGNYSTALGFRNTASGDYSTAIGYFTRASGNYSTAMGVQTYALNNYATALGCQTIASGQSTSTAMGYFTTASGSISTAMGRETIASGDYSTSIGSQTTASGAYSTSVGKYTTASGASSTAMGVQASTNGYNNSFCIGGVSDLTSNPLTQNTQNNQMMMRFDNYTFWISPSNYAYLIPASNGWAYTSDRNKKERFEELNGETVLQKISSIPFYSWNFKEPTTRQYRHYGIMAQDFFDAFGKDSYGNIGNDTTVSPLDMLGVDMAAIKALEKRSTALAGENEQLKAANLKLEKRMEMVEAMLNELKAVKEKRAVANK